MLRQTVFIQVRRPKKPEFTHVAFSFDAGFPTGNAQRALGEDAYTLAPSILVSRELGKGKYQIFTTTGLDFVVKRRRLDPTREVPRNSFFSNSGVTVHAGHGWMVSELSVTSNRSDHGRETQLAVTPSMSGGCRGAQSCCSAFP
jgi:hypothetical protein